MQPRNGCILTLEERGKTVADADGMCHFNSFQIESFQAVDELWEDSQQQICNTIGWIRNISPSSKTIPKPDSEEVQYIHQDFSSILPTSILFWGRYRTVRPTYVAWFIAF